MMFSMNEREEYKKIKTSYATGDFHHTIVLLLEYIKQHAREAQSLNNLGAMYYLTGQREKAAEYFEKAAARDSAFIMPRINLKYVIHNEEMKKKSEYAPPELDLSDNLNRSGLVSIIIPAYNKWHLTKNCLDALYKLTDAAAREIIVIDNSTNNETQNGIQCFPAERLAYARNKENVGFARACNQGAKMARGDYILFLNNDTLPLQGWLDELLKVLQNNPDVAAAGSKLLYEDNMIQHGGVAFLHTNKMPFHIYKKFPASHPAVNKTRDFQAVTAACILIRRKIFFDAGMFDERYTNGYEDVDFCLKIRRMGHRIVYAHKSALYHLEGQSEGRTHYEDKNLALFRSLWKDKIIPDEEKYILADNTNILHSFDHDAIFEKKQNAEFQKLCRHFYKLITRHPEFIPHLYLTHLKNYQLKKAYGYFYDMAGNDILFTESPALKRIFLKEAILCSPLHFKSAIKYIKYLSK